MATDLTLTFTSNMAPKRIDRVNYYEQNSKFFQAAGF
jgi:hypothetical protein